MIHRRVSSVLPNRPLAAILLVGSTGCYGTLSANHSHRGSLGAGATATADGTLAAMELGYASHFVGDQPQTHALRAGLAAGFPVTAPTGEGFTLIPRAYVGVDHAWSSLAGDTSYPLGAELSGRWLFHSDWGVVVSPRYFFHAGSDWEPARDHEVALLVGITECLDRKNSFVRFCL